MEPTKSTSAQIIRAGAYTGVIAVFIIAGVILTGWLTWVLRMLYLPFLGLAIFFLLPFIFQKQFRSRFVTSAVLKFFPDGFTVELTNPRTGALVRKDENRYNAIKAFKALNSAKDDSSFLKLLFAEGDTVSYTFVGQVDGDTKNNIVDIVSQDIRAYNEQQDQLSRITYLPPLFASKFGLYAILVLTLLLIAAVVVENIYKPRAIPFTLMPGALLLFVILLQRKRDLDLYKKMS